MPRVAVVGGSLGGLTTALVLRDLGCEVTVFERSAAALEARGAGIAALEATLRYPTTRLGIPARTFCSSTEWIRFLDSNGNVVNERRHPYLFSSWNAIYRTLLAAIDPADYRLGKDLIRFANAGDTVNLEFADGTEDDFDLLVCADGITSGARKVLLPDVSPSYAGYVAWRGVIPESDLSPATYATLHDALTYQLLPNSHILVYPIPNTDGAVEPGRRLMNIVWYRNVAPDGLAEFLTDRDGHPRTVSLPPGTVPDSHISEMREFARTHLAPAIAEVVTGIAEPFLQAIFDIEVPRMAFGRICLVGDAAFAARPHAAAGTAKAAEDGWVLGHELAAAGGDVGAALAKWECRQLTLGAALLARTREIGDASQFLGTFHAEHPSLIFGLHGPDR